MNIEQWNKRFSELNNVPLNVKWSPSGQNNYLKQLMYSRPDYFKNPDNYPVTPITPPPSTPAIAPSVPSSPPTGLTDLQPALIAARATVKAIEDLIARGA